MKAEVKKEQSVNLKTEVNELSNHLLASLARALSLAEEPGASAWLSARPVQEHGFSLHKTAFRDAVALRYGGEPDNLPSHCVWGKLFDVTPALSCAKGGFVIVRHNEIRDLTASLLEEVCHDVETEPGIQPLSGEQFSSQSTTRDNAARLNVKASGFFWGGRFECTFFDVRIFNPHVRSNQSITKSMTLVYLRHEMAKRRMYNQSVRDVEMASFTPLVFSTSGGWGPAATVAMKRVAALLHSQRES